MKLGNGCLTISLCILFGIPSNNAALQSLVSCGNDDNDVMAPTCAECPPGDETTCTSSDCTWHPHTTLCRESFSNNIRTASVHLWHETPSTLQGQGLRPAWWFQRVVPIASADATYFSSNGHRFGYGGIQQVDATTGLVLFSLWDQGGCDQDINPNCNSNDIAQTVACGEDVTCTDFGGEGTGRKSYFTIQNMNFPILNEEYYFVTQAAYLGNRRMEYTGYFYENGTWRLLSRIQVSTNANEEWWLGGLYSFVEQWSAVDTTEDRSALFGPSFMASTDGLDFVQIPSATFSHGTAENHEHVNAWQAGADMDYAVGIATGGSTEREAVRGDTFDYPPVDVYPELTEFSGYISCLNTASTKDEIEACFQSMVNCGNHEALTCAECPQGNGAAWCNGECTWWNGQCVHLTDVEITASPSPIPTTAPTSSPSLAPSPTPTSNPSSAPTDTPPTFVNCGGHQATSCAECPQGNGAAWCNGECTWWNSQCIHSTDVEATPPPSPAPEACDDNDNWRFQQRNGRIRDCTWVSGNTNKRCRKEGYLIGSEETVVTAEEGCAGICGSC